MNQTQTKNEERNFKARQYYHNRVAKDPEFVKYTNERVKQYNIQRKIRDNTTNHVIGRPRTRVIEPTEPKRRGRKLKYENEIYKLV